MPDEIATMDAAAHKLGHAHIMQDVNNIAIRHAATLASVKAVLDGILATGEVDFNAVAEASGGFETMGRLIDCIRREIQVITGGH
jgi:hypothetical protein